MRFATGVPCDKLPTGSSTYMDATYNANDSLTANVFTRDVFACDVCTRVCTYLYVHAFMPTSDDSPRICGHVTCNLNHMCTDKILSCA